MDPHAVVELLNEYFSEMTDLIFESGGTLDKYLGDGIMVLYGAPFASPDDALKRHQDGHRDAARPGGSQPQLGGPRAAAAADGSGDQHRGR
jgi:class 3 adenylate cyclase